MIPLILPQYRDQNARCIIIGQLGRQHAGTQTHLAVHLGAVDARERMQQLLHGHAARWQRLLSSCPLAHPLHLRGSWRLAAAPLSVGS